LPARVDSGVRYGVGVNRFRRAVGKDHLKDHLTTPFERFTSLSSDGCTIAKEIRHVQIPYADIARRGATRMRVSTSNRSSRSATRKAAAPKTGAVPG
jgi:hypothetical protein